jgi:methionyl-tRNA formyltransferase
MGTPEFAVASLKAINDNGFEIVGVITAPDKPAGRGSKIQMPAVKKYAIEENIGPVLQPQKLRDVEFLSTLSALHADLFIVVAFRMLPEEIFSMAPLGTINLHASLLPQYRGAAPINWVIINGETKTGVTTFFIEKEIDTGNIILQEQIDILPVENAGTLHDKLMTMGANLVVETIRTVIKNRNIGVPQQSLKGISVLKPAPKIFKETCRIPWDKPVKEIHNLVRGLCPYPCAWTELQGTDGSTLQLKIFETEYTETQNLEHCIGKVLYNSNNSLKIACKDGYLNILSLQIAGKSRMDTKSFLLGFKNRETFTSVS